MIDLKSCHCIDVMIVLGIDLDISEVSEELDDVQLFFDSSGGLLEHSGQLDVVIGEALPVAEGAKLGNAVCRHVSRGSEKNRDMFLDFGGFYFV